MCIYIYIYIYDIYIYIYVYIHIHMYIYRYNSDSDSRAAGGLRPERRAIRRNTKIINEIKRIKICYTDM